MRHRIGGKGVREEGRQGTLGSYGVSRTQHPHPQHLSYPFTHHNLDLPAPPPHRTPGMWEEEIGGPLQWQVKGLHTEPLKLCHLKTLDLGSITSPNEGTALSVCTLSLALSLGPVAMERDKNPHHPASPIYTLAVTSTPTLNTGGQSEELGSDRGNIPQIGEEGFQSNLQSPGRVRPEISGRNWGDSLPGPTPPQGSDDPPPSTHILAATHPKRNQIVANFQLSLWGEEVDQADGRETPWECQPSVPHEHWAAGM